VSSKKISEQEYINNVYSSLAQNLIPHNMPLNYGFYRATGYSLFIENILAQLNAGFPEKAESNPNYQNGVKFILKCITTGSDGDIIQILHKYSTDTIHPKLKSALDDLIKINLPVI